MIRFNNLKELLDFIDVNILAAIKNYDIIKHLLTDLLKSYIDKSWFDLKPLVDNKFKIDVVKPDPSFKFKEDYIILDIALFSKLHFYVYIDKATKKIKGFDNFYKSWDGKHDNILPIGYNTLDMYAA